MDDRENLIIAKRRGNRVRWQDRATGAWDPEWWPLFVQVPTDAPIIGLNADEFNDMANAQQWGMR